jgi:hypothetical protein
MQKPLFLERFVELLNNHPFPALDINWSRVIECWKRGWTPEETIKEVIKLEQISRI